MRGRIFPRVLLAAAATLLFGALTLSSEEERSSAPAANPNPRKPLPHNEVTALLDDVEVRPATVKCRYRSLTVFPVVLLRRPDRRRYQTLDEGLANGTLTVRELPGGVVGKLLVRNSSKLHTFLLAGEILLGGKQNRILRQDVLLPPRSEEVAVSVYCGERGRWTVAKRFESKGTLAPQNLRIQALRLAPQTNIWENIAREHRRYEVASPTENLQVIYEKKKVRETLEAYREALTPALKGEMVVGFVAARNSQILGAEVFRSPSLFARLRGKLLDAYAVVCLGTKEKKREGKRPRPSLADARAFLRRAYRANYRIHPTPGVGRLLLISGPVSGQALGYAASCVHLSLAPSVRILKGERPVVRPLPLRQYTPGPETPPRGFRPD